MYLKVNKFFVELYNNVYDFVAVMKMWVCPTNVVAIMTNYTFRSFHHLFFRKYNHFDFLGGSNRLMNKNWISYENDKDPLSLTF